jgi:hypothetical protein
MMGGVKIGEVRYCSAACRFQNFMGRFNAALSATAAAHPHPLPQPAPTPGPTDFPADESDAAGVMEGSKELIVDLIGWGVIAVVAAIIYALVKLVNYPFHSQTFWFVIPVGSLLCGMVAGAGFWVALRVLNRRPNAWTYLAAGLGGACGYGLIFFLMWWLTEFQGVKLRDEVKFLDYLELVIEHQRIRMARAQGEGFEVGKWGYARFAINMAGFGLGVIAMVALAGGKTYCPKCRRYLKTLGKQIRSSSDPERHPPYLPPLPRGGTGGGVIAGVLSGQLSEALEFHAASGSIGKKEFWSTTLTVEACPGCGIHLGTLTASVPGDNGQQTVDGFVFKGSTDQPVRHFG